MNSHVRFIKAINICLKYDEINTHLLQRKLMIGYSTAHIIFKKLKELKVITGEKYIYNPFGKVKVGTVDKKTARFYLVN
ncbi:MAG: hypothetical protein V1858_02855 [Candidatus Gottesmanbacteria bacterium]